MKSKYARLAVMCLVFAISKDTFGGILSVPFFSQLDPQWKNQLLGSSNDTLGSKGCAVTSMAMILKYRGAPCDPGKLNIWLKNNQGYSGGNLIIWSKAAGYLNASWMKYEGTGRIESLFRLSEQIDSRRLIIAESKRFSGRTHFVVLFGVSTDQRTGFYWDPIDPPATSTIRKIGDGWVNIGAGTRVFRY